MASRSLYANDPFYSVPHTIIWSLSCPSLSQILCSTNERTWYVLYWDCIGDSVVHSEPKGYPLAHYELQNLQYNLQYHRSNTNIDSRSKYGEVEYSAVVACGRISIPTLFWRSITYQIFLVILFYFLDILYYLLVALLCCSSFMGASFTFYPLFEFLLTKYNLQREHT